MLAKFTVKYQRNLLNEHKCIDVKQFQELEKFYRGLIYHDRHVCPQLLTESVAEL